MKIKRFLFGLYSYLFNLFYIFLDLLPPFLRYAIFKIMFKKFGKDNNIDYKTYFRYPSKITLGNNVWVNKGCQIFGSFHIKDAEIIFGDNIALGPNVTIFSASHDYKFLNLPDTARSVVIEDNVWIGGNSTILPGVVIGEGSIIGAGSIVTRSIPPYSVAIGSPAVVVKRREIVDDSI
ncbi:acyltransferase [Paenibacillus aquistagni]|uniref:Acetyltransferase (Isoleucine patch superfamily) n=1 Tax=Paenibacillus aquistagni TaxID=1852522 RepID=A0A1X7KYR3_9BACL|nr:DapH/DapD/GlmU-related protein [Paenibacillus aquistagni]SMG46758.1 Acetyltransferase (isoleucine patch superfamily) [Paenibacillus aquistagni]